MKRYGIIYELEDAIGPITLEDLQVIRKLKSFPCDFAKIGILSRLGFEYDEETGYSSKGFIKIRYDKINFDYEVTNNCEEHIPVDGLISLAWKKYSKSLKKSHKIENNCLYKIEEKVEAIS